MNMDNRTSLYTKYYQEVYDYVKDKVKTPERAVDVTQKTFAEIFKMPDIPEKSEKFMELAKNIADKKRRIPGWKIHIREEVIVIVLSVAITIPILLDSTPEHKMEEELESWVVQWETGQWDEMFFAAFSTISKLDAGADVTDRSDSIAAYTYSGVGDANLIKNGVTTWVEPNELCYVAMIQAYNEDEIDQVIGMIKNNLKPEEWFVFEDGDAMNRTHQERWGKVSMDDFGFYVNGDCILITYIDPELVESGEVISVDEMRERFDLVMAIRKKKLEG